MMALGLGADTFDSRTFSSQVPRAILAKHAVKLTSHPASEHTDTRAGNSKGEEEPPDGTGGFLPHPLFPDYRAACDSLEDTRPSILQALPCQHKQTQTDTLS